MLIPVSVNLSIPMSFVTQNRLKVDSPRLAGAQDTKNPALSENTLH